MTARSPGSLGEFDDRAVCRAAGRGQGGRAQQYPEYSKPDRRRDRPAERCTAKRRETRRRLLGAWGLAWTLWACGGAAPLPDPLPTPSPFGASNASRGRTLLANRALGRTGFACIDCHRVAEYRPTDAVRPAPDLGGRRTSGPWWRGLSSTRPGAINLCFERHLAGAQLAPEVLADLEAALGAAPPRPANPSPAAVDGANLYRRACAHCHSAGPAPSLDGRRWARSKVQRAIRGRRPMHPDRLMPAFARDVLTEAAVNAIADWLAVGGEEIEP